MMLSLTHCSYTQVCEDNIGMAREGGVRKREGGIGWEGTEGGRERERNRDASTGNYYR